MTILQQARELYAAGRIHDALEAAQAACDRAPKDAEAWCLLGRISRHAGLVAASDEAFRRAALLDAGQLIPHRVSPAHFRELVDDALAHRTGPFSVQAIPTADQVRAGVDPDALTARDPAGALVLFQVNHENRSADEADLRTLISRSLAPA